MNISQAQRSFQRAGVKSLERKREVLKKLEGRSVRETEKILAVEFPEVAKPDQMRTLNESQTEIRFVADQELLSLLERVRTLAAHREVNSYNSLFKFLAQEALKKLEPKEATKNPVQNNPPQLPALEAAPRKSRSRYISTQVRRAVWSRDEGKCAYVSPLTGRRCGSQHAVQFEHVSPWAKGGTNTTKNLQLLCRAHNQESAIQAFGEAKLKRSRKPVRTALKNKLDPAPE